LILKKRQTLQTTALVALLLSLLFLRCEPQEEIINYNFTDGLLIDTDTVLFDTVFTNAGSITKRLKVVNPSSNALQISRITLAGGASSSYTMFVDGMERTMVEDQLILGNDSLLILVDVFIDPLDQDAAYLVSDSIVFETNGQIQDVKLVAWGQDANYLGNVVLPCETVWTPGRPYVLYGSVMVDTLCTLKIEPNTRIFATKDSYLYVGGRLLARGTAKKRILMRNDRIGFPYDDLPGQWGGIVFLEGTHNNEIIYTDIRNAIYGVRLGAPDQDTIPDVVLKNTIIENMSNSGILCFTSDLYAENTLVNGCLQFTCANIAGGHYTYRHCTFGNYSLNYIRDNPTLLISDNLLLDDGTDIIEDITVSMQNSIVYGDLQEEVLFDLSGGAAARLSLSHNIFRSSIPELDINENILNQDPEFINPYKNNYALDTLSPAKDTGEPIGISIDLQGSERDELPDIGAYERLE
jgi:hypothetical protein